ncbi:MAG: chromate transporter [Oscillospiraceae bacterium]
MLYLRLFYEFFKTGLFAVGGGLATLPFLEEMAGRTGWFTHAQLADMIAVGESTPGPVGVNMATYVGFTVAGVPGALTATVGLVTPSVIIILLIALFLKNFRENPLVKGAFYGLRPASTGLIAAAGVSVLSVAMLRPSASGGLLDCVDWKAAGLAAVLLYLTRWCRWTKKRHPIVFILASAAVGVLLHFGA